MEASNLKNPLRHWIWSTWIATALCVSAVIAGAGLDATGPAVVGGGLLVLCLFLLLAFYILGYIYRRQIRELMNGEAWFHWTYSRDQWERFLQAEWGRTRKRLLKLGGMFAAAGLAGGLLPAWLDGTPSTGLTAGISIAVAFGGVVPGLALFAAWTSLRSALNGPAEAYIGPRGAYLQGTYLAWGSQGPRSCRLSVLHNMPVVRIELHGKSSPDGPPEVRLAVPLGREAEGEELVRRLRAMKRSS